jgi:hypothetical protein
LYSKHFLNADDVFNAWKIKDIFPNVATLPHYKIPTTSKKFFRELLIFSRVVKQLRDKCALANTKNLLNIWEERQAGKARSILYDWKYKKSR